MPDSPRGAAELFDFDSLDASNEPADAQGEEKPTQEQPRSARNGGIPVPVLPEWHETAEASVRQVLGVAAAAALDTLAKRQPLPLPAGSAVYQGQLSHPDFGEGLLLRLETSYQGGLWRGEWTAMDQSEPVELQLHTAEAPEEKDNFGAVSIRSRHGAETATEFLGTVAADGTISGEVFQEGVGGGHLQLRPEATGAAWMLPSDWSTISKGRDIFVAGWGGFDVTQAYQSFQTSLDQKGGDRESIPSVEVLRSYGYLERFFPGLVDPLQRERLRTALLVPTSALAQFVVRNASFWSNPGHANRLDEVMRHFGRVPTKGVKAAIKENPRALLNRLSREQAVASLGFVQFAHLTEVMQVVYFSGDGQELPGERACDAVFTLSVLKDSHSVAKAAQELNNCAAGYVGDVRRKRCALIVLHREGKLVAMGEWDLQDRKWSQISEHSDEPVRADWQHMFDQLRRDWLFPMQVQLQLPGGQGDAVSIFNPAAARSLEPLLSSRQSGLARTLLLDWPSALSRSSCHPEAAGALLLHVVAGAGSEEAELGAQRHQHQHGCQGRLVELASLLLRSYGADVDTMTDGGWTALMLAVEGGHPALVKLLLDAQADLDAKGADTGRTALMMAASAGQMAFLSALMDKKADLDVVARLSGKTALLEAAEQASWPAALSLVEAGASLDAQRHDGKTALILAAQAGRNDLVQAMVDRGAKLDLQSEDGTSALLAAHAGCRWQTLRVLLDGGASLDLLLGRERKSLLMLAALAGHADTVELLVEKQAGMELCNEHGETALGMALADQQWASVLRLAELAADVNAKSKDGHTSVTLAAALGDSRLVEQLVKRRADLDRTGPDGLSGLAHAAVAGHQSTVRALADLSADLNCAGDGGKPALLAAALARKWPSVQLLVELGARLEVRDSLHQTTLIVSAAHGNSKVVAQLLERRASLEARARDGCTALLAAARERQWILVRRLADARADLEATPSPDPSAGEEERQGCTLWRKTAILLVTESLQWETAAHLARRGAKLNVQGDAGKTPLMLAVECGQDDVVSCFLQRKADPEIQDSSGDTPMLRACNRQLEHIMRILWEAGASTEQAVARASIPRMANILMKWSGADVEDV